MKTAADIRKRQLAQIHIAQTQLGMDDSAYREMLWAIGRVRSAKELDWAGRKRVLDHLAKCGFKPRGGSGRPNNIDSADRGPQLRKVEALLADAKRPWSYADSLAQRMFGVDRIGFCTPQQLWSITAALSVDAKRRGKG